LEEKFRRSVAALGDLRGQTVLTVCGGSGMDAEFLARAGANVIASDISLGAAKRTAERAQRFGVSITPIVADVEHLPFPDQSVDIVYVHDGLHHLETPLVGLKEMARVAKHAVSITEPYDAALTGLAVRVGIAQAVEEAGNRGARLNERDITATLMEAGLPIMHVDRYAMYYKHRPGPVMQALSLPGIEPIAQAGWQAANAVLGRAGNKLTIQAIRRLRR
jgi:SAM-dependent methyltransferase